VGEAVLEAGALHRYGAAVHPLEHSPVDEDAEITTDSLGSDLEFECQRAHLHAAVPASLGQNALPTLVGLHS